MKKSRSSPVTRRLAPLYIAVFLQNIVFWYAVDKLFMLEIGFNTASIGVVVAIMSIMMLIVETPSGVLADRWSRKGIMTLGCITLLISGIVGALSFNEPIYIISVVFWGIYAAFYSGTYEAVIYDVAVEEHGNGEKFEKYLGRFRAVEGVAAVIGALSGGFIASTLDIRDSYTLSVPFIFIALLFLWKFREPQLHKMEVSEPVFRHIRQTFAAVLKNRVLLPVIIATVGFVILQQTLFEFSQLWFIAVAAPVALYGVFSAAVVSSWTIGGLLASRMKSKIANIVLTLALLATIISLIAAQNFVTVLIAQFIIAVCLVALSVILAKKMHDELPSRLRAGSSSIVSTLTRIILIPGSILFTIVANNNSISSATYILLGLAIVASIAFLSIARTPKIKTA